MFANAFLLWVREASTSVSTETTDRPIELLFSIQLYCNYLEEDMKYKKSPERNVSVRVLPDLTEDMSCLMLFPTVAKIHQFS